MPITQLSYHICDFIQDETGRLYMLELGDAWYNSVFRARIEYAGVDVRGKLIPEHVDKLGAIHYQHTAFRDFKQTRQRQRNYAELDDVYLAPDPNRIKVLVAIGEDDTPKQLIQELTAQNKQKTSVVPDIILNGTTDMFFLINRDKKILNTLLSLNQLSALQPRTWHFECKEGAVFSLPENIPHFIIKHPCAALADGMLVVPREELALVLSVIANQDETRLTEQQLTSYSKGIAHYKNKPEKSIIIQEVCLSQRKTLQHKDNTVTHHQAAGRAVFAVIEEDDELRIEMIDCSWQLAVQPATLEKITNDTIISAKQEQFPEPSFSAAEKQQLEPVISTMLTTLMQAANKMDIRSYLLALAEQKRVADIQYLMQSYSHIRINRLDATLIETLQQIDKPLAQRYLLKQAEYYLLAHHLVHVQDGALENWLFEEIDGFSPALKERLEKFIKQECENVAELGYNKKDSAWLNRIERVKQKLRDSKPGIAATMPFFNNQNQQATAVTTPVHSAASSPAP